jgi:hypothetical protein
MNPTHTRIVDRDWLVIPTLWLLFAAGCAIMAATGSGCSTAPSTSRPVAAATLVEDTVEEDSPPAIIGRGRYIERGLPCETRRGYLPFIRFNQPFPMVNEWITLTGARSSISSPNDPPIQSAWVIGHGLYPNPFTIPIAPGCQLLIRPIAVLNALPRGPSQMPQTFGRFGAWSEGATSFLLINPGPELLGHSIFVQMIEVAPGENMAGILISQTVQLQIGDSKWIRQ